MENYKFLLKPAFFIFNLLFATWLVLKIEQVSPSDFGKYKYLFEPAAPDKGIDMPYVRKLCSEYRHGLIDSVAFDHQMQKVLGVEKPTMQAAGGN